MGSKFDSAILAHIGRILSHWATRPYWLLGASITSQVCFAQLQGQASIRQSWPTILTWSLRFEHTPGTVAILAQGTSRAVAVTQAFFFLLPDTSLFATHWTSHLFRGINEASNRINQNNKQPLPSRDQEIPSYCCFNEQRRLVVAMVWPFLLSDHMMWPSVKFSQHQWSSGRIHRCHRCDPGSIPG